MPHISAQDQAVTRVLGAEHDASISLILDHSSPGHGPRLHRHSYDETWVVRAGNLTFQLDDQRLDAGPGDIVIAPAGAAHKFTNRGPGDCDLVCIQASPIIVGEWLE